MRFLLFFSLWSGFLSLVVVFTSVERGSSSVKVNSSVFISNFFLFGKWSTSEVFFELGPIITIGLL